MGEVRHTADTTRRTPIDVLGSERDTGSFRVKAALGLAAVLMIPPVVMGVNGWKEGRELAEIANYMDEREGSALAGLVPKLERVSGMLPRIEAGLETAASIDLSTLIPQVEVLEFDEGFTPIVADVLYDVEVPNAQLDFEFKRKVGVSAFGVGVSSEIPLPGYTSNNQINGLALQQIMVPEGAARGITVNGKTIIQVDGSNLAQHISWYDGPKLSKFTINSDGTKNFDDPASFIEDWRTAKSSISALLGDNEAKIAVDSRVENFRVFAQDAVLENVNSACSDDYIEEIEAATKTQFLKAATDMFGLDAENVTVEVRGDINYSEPNYTYPKKGPAKVAPPAKNVTVDAIAPTKEELAASIVCELDEFKAAPGAQDD